MQPIICPSIKLHTCHQDQGTYINALILEHQGNNYHIHGGTSDTIHVYTQGLGIYVLSINKGYGRMILNAYMAPEPDSINGVYMHTPQDIQDILGVKWERLSPKAITEKLINYLM